MRITIADTLTVGDVSLSCLSVSVLRRALGPPDSCEEIRMHGGGTRYRERWPSCGLSTLRDDEEKEAVCLFVDASRGQVVIGEQEIPSVERAFLKAFPTAQKWLGHSYKLETGPWYLHVDFARSKKRIGVGSSIRHLDRISISPKAAANKPVEAMPVPRPEIRQPRSQSFARRGMPHG